MVGQAGLQLAQDDEQVVGGLVEATHGVVYLGLKGGAASVQGVGAFEEAEAELLGEHGILGHEAGQKLVLFLVGQLKKGFAEVRRKGGHEQGRRYGPRPAGSNAERRGCCGGGEVNAEGDQLEPVDSAHHLPPQRPIIVTPNYSTAGTTSTGNVLCSSTCADTLR